MVANVDTNRAFRIGAFMDGAFRMKGHLGAFNLYKNLLMTQQNIFDDYNNTKLNYGYLLDNQVATACFNVGNIPLGITSNSNNAILNYGLLRNTRVIVKTTQSTIFDNKLTHYS